MTPFPAFPAGTLPDLVAYLEIAINGQVTSAGFMDDLMSLEVRASRGGKPDSCMFVIGDEQFGRMEGTSTDPAIVGGERLTITASRSKDAPMKTIFDGEVISVDMDGAMNALPTLTVHALSLDHRLRMRRMIRTFEQVKDSDIADTIARAAGFSLIKDETQAVRPWIIQANLDDWSFLRARARENGYVLYRSGYNTLHFAKRVKAPSTPVALTWGKTLRSFRARTSIGRMVGSVVVRGWKLDKTPIIGTATTASGGDAPVIDDPDAAEPSAAAGSDAAGEPYTVVTANVNTQQDADTLAASVYDALTGLQFHGEGECDGDPAVMPGEWVSIHGLNMLYGGKFLVRSVVHRFNHEDGYVTQFTAGGDPVNGDDDDSLLESLGVGGGIGVDASAMAGGPGALDESRAALTGSVALALVTDNADPENKGRVKVTYPWLSSTDASYWARLVSPMAGASRGLYLLPEVDDEVMVVFEQGDITRPYIIGGLWNDTDTVIEGNSAAVVDSKVVRRQFKTRVGHVLLFDDTDEKGLIEAKTNGGHAVTLSDKGGEVNVTVKTAAGHKLTLDDTNKELTLQDVNGTNKIAIDLNSNAMTLKCGGDFTIDATGKVTVKGQAGLELNTPAQLKATGVAGVTVEATGPAQLKSAVLVEVQGALVKIN